MTRHAPLVRALADRLLRRGIDSLVYFHTDHFEPWRSVGERVPPVGPEIVDGIHDFLRTTERIDFARKLSLFYKPHLNYALRRDGEATRADPGDLVGFLPRSEAEERFGKAAMEAITGQSSHAIELHIHHEYYTATTAHTDPAAAEWFATPLGRALDGARLALAIRLNREIIARETGRASPQRWFFVHGHWALNGSDDSSCAITDEIEILLRHGCRGDFTFPAGRPHVNPRIKVPYLCRPVNAPKGYDLAEAEPEIACGNREAARSKFFIWASPATSLQCSLDYMSEASRRKIANTERAAAELIDMSYAAGRRLFIKTHAHSMHAHYFEHVRTAVFPHQYPATQTLLSVIFDAAAHAGIEVEFLTVGEVYDLLTETETKPEIDLAATYLRGGISLFGNRSAALGETQASGNGVHKGVATKRLAPVAAVELVREMVSAVLEERIERLGPRGSGAYDHYSAMLRRGFPIPVYELAALDIVRRHVPRLHSYHEIGSGIATLPFLLALDGFRAFGIERDQRRHASAVAIWQELAGKSGVAATDCQLLRGSFPDAVKRLDVSQSIAIVTDFITTQTAEQLQSIFAGLRRYRFLLLDLQRFCVKREQREEQLALLAELRAQGFVPTLEIDDNRGHEYTFALFENDAAARQRQRPEGAWSRVIRAWR